MDRCIIALPQNFPRIVCLCGSTRFKDAFEEAQYQETMAGRIVLTVGFLMHASGNRHGESVGCTPEQKIALDELHKRKIDLCDEVLVLNVKQLVCQSCQKICEADFVPFGAGGGSWSKCCRAHADFQPYIGSSTRSEIEYAERINRLVRYLEPMPT